MPRPQRPAARTSGRLHGTPHHPLSLAAEGVSVAAGGERPANRLDQATAEARRPVVDQWVGTRYLDDALEALQDRQQAQEQETQQRGRGGLGLDF